VITVAAMAAGGDGEALVDAGALSKGRGGSGERGR